MLPHHSDLFGFADGGVIFVVKRFNYCSMMMGHAAAAGAGSQNVADVA